MKLYNTIVVFDVYCAAESEEDAREAVIASIRDAEKPLEISQQSAHEATTEKYVRTKWHDERPIVGNLVSNEDFEKLKGKTTLQVRELIYGKEVKK